MLDAVAIAAAQSGADSATEKVVEETVEDIEKVILFNPTVDANVKVVEETQEFAARAK